MLQIKDFASITAGALNFLSGTQSKLTDFNVGSVTRTIVEAVASVIDELYIRMIAGLLDAVPAATYKTFKFDALPATGSTGTVRFSRATPASTQILIPAGARVANQDGTLVWAVTGSGGAIAVGATYADVPVLCTSTGAKTNISAGVITQIVDQITGVSRVTNLYQFTTGADVESEQARQVRFQRMIATLARGVLGAVEYGAATAQVVVNGVVQESVTEVKGYEPYTIDPVAYPVGYVEVYIHSGGSTQASDAIVARAQQIVNGYYESDGTPVFGWKAAGIIAQVAAASIQTVNVAANITVLSGYDESAVSSAVQLAVSRYLLSLAIGQECVTAEIEAAIMGVEGVYNCVLTSPSVAVVLTTTRGHRFAPGAFTLT